MLIVPPTCLNISACLLRWTTSLISSDILVYWNTHFIEYTHNQVQNWKPPLGPLFFYFKGEINYIWQIFYSLKITRCYIWYLPGAWQAISLLPSRTVFLRDWLSSSHCKYINYFALRYESIERLDYEALYDICYLFLE